jgi:hypothetical protein
MTTPRCPYCNAQGIAHLQVKIVGVFVLVYCGQCGAIHGIIPAPQQVPEISPPERAAVPAEVQPRPEPPPGPEPPPVTDSKPEQTLTPERAYLLQRPYIQKATCYLKVVDPEGEATPRKR